MSEFETYLRQQRMSEKSIYAYLSEINAFEDWLVNLTGLPFEANRLEPAFLDKYTSYLRFERKYHPSTINKKLAALRKWLQMLKRSGRWPYEIDLPDVKVQKKRRAPKWLEPQQVAAILYAVEQEENEFLRARDRCMVFFELFRGIRIGESMDLEMPDVITTPGKQKIIIRSGKGGKYDEIDISKSRKLLGAIQEWIDVRSRAKYAKSPYFFISFRSGKVTIGAVNKMVDRIRERSHVQYTTHQLRHTFIHEFERASKDLRSTHEVARHSNIDTTLLYTMPSEKDIAELYQRIEDKY